LCLSLSVEILWRQNGLGDNRCASIRLESAEEATAVSFVADCHTGHLDANEKRIAVAIEAEFPQREPLPTAFTLRPKLLARTAIKRDKTCPESLFDSFLVHEAEHQDFIVAGVLDDGRDKPVFFFEVEFHFSPLKNKKPAGAFCASGPMSPAFLFQLATTPRARERVMMVAMMVKLCSLFHCDIKITGTMNHCQAKSGLTFGVVFRRERGSLSPFC
jgi:hypothetical protein